MPILALADGSCGLWRRRSLIIITGRTAAAGRRRSPMPMDTPTDAWPHAAAPENCVAAADLMADTERYGKTYQLLAIRDGKIILELCGEGKTPDSTSVSWSM
eukprot:COSAG01_NODE_36373_length_518_cov_9.751790_1_plen_101_part_10